MFFVVGYAANCLGLGCILGLGSEFLVTHRTKIEAKEMPSTILAANLQKSIVFFAGQQVQTLARSRGLVIVYLLEYRRSFVADGSRVGATRKAKHWAVISDEWQRIRLVWLSKETK